MAISSIKDSALDISTWAWQETKHLGVCRIMVIYVLQHADILRQVANITQLIICIISNDIKLLSFFNSGYAVSSTQSCLTFCIYDT